MIPLFLTTVLVYIYVLFKWPHLVLRPSVWFALAMLIRINGAAAFQGPDMDWQLYRAGTFRLLTLSFPLGVMLWVMMTPRLSSIARAYSRRTFGLWGNRQVSGESPTNSGILAREVTAHVTGGAGVDMMLDAFERANEEIPLAPLRCRRKAWVD